MKNIRVRIVGLILLVGFVLAGFHLLRLAGKPPAPAEVKPSAGRNAARNHEAPAASIPSRLAPAASPATTTAQSSRSAPPSSQLWASPTVTQGEKLNPKSAHFLKAKATGTKLPGRSATFDPGSLAPLASLKRGDSVVIPLLGGEQVIGRVNLVQPEDDGWVRIGGELTGPRTGSFSLGRSGNKMGGIILLPQEELACVISEQTAGQVLIQEKHLSEVMCFSLPRPRNEPVIVPAQLASASVTPLLSSRTGASAVLYLDFDGETVTDPMWNSGNTIVALPSYLTTAQIIEVWNRVKEDFSPFNLDITTDLSRYLNAPVGRRMRCIITPTETAAPGKGGVAFLNSFARSGQGGFSSTIPCWAFAYYDPKGCAETISHEVGHTFGLGHDGGIVASDRTEGFPGEAQNEYYHGDLANSGSTVGWAPIMGVGYYQEFVQWSKGEYANANNHEDDIAIIANGINGFGLITDDAGNSRGTAATLNAPGGSVNQTGIISAGRDVDFYVFSVSTTTTVSVEAYPASVSPNLDIRLELQDSAGAVLASYKPNTALNAAVSASMAAGTYYLKVYGTGRGDALADGYSSYGSIGAYSLTGSTGTGSSPAGSSGTVVAWGDNSFGQTNVPAGLNGVTAISAGYGHTVALKSDATVVAWGDNTYGQRNVPSNLSGVKAIAAGSFFTLALKSDGTVVAWGHNSGGVIQSIPAGLSGVVAIAAGIFHGVALKNDGTVVAWEHPIISNGQATVPVGLSGVTAVAASGYHTVALKSDGTVVTWGTYVLGGVGVVYQPTVPDGLSGVVAVAAGPAHTVAVKSDGTVVSWGNVGASNSNLKLSTPGGMSLVAAVAAGFYHTVGLKRYGTVVSWGYNSDGQTTVPTGLSGVTAIAAGDKHTVALVNGTPVPPSFTVNPQNQTVAKGANVTFSASASGTSPMRFQWLFNNAPISGATSATLTLNNVQPGNAGRYSLRAVNAVSSAVSSPATLAVQADPANGTPRPPVTITAVPPKAPGKDSLIVITHGWQFGVPSIFLNNDVPWVTDMATTIRNKLAQEGKDNWQVNAKMWGIDATWHEPWFPLELGHIIGENLGKEIAGQPWSHVHLIGHSAGAGLIQRAAEVIKQGSSPPTVHTTFLDPFVGYFKEHRGTYGRSADWSDNYYSEDLSGGRTSSVPLSQNVDVTVLDPDQSITHLLHTWPHDFYTKTVTNGLAAALGYGFPLSLEGGNWANKGTFQFPRVLDGILPVDVAPNVRQNAENSKLTVSGAGAVPVLTSPTGTVQVNNDVIQLLSGYTLPLPLPPQTLSPASLRQTTGSLVPASLPVLEPVWVSLGVTVTNLVNYVKFEARFTSAAGAQGVCSVYWGTNLVGLLDERVASSGAQTYRFPLPETYRDGQYTLGFRLDAYTATPSSLTLTNVVTGFYGITNPPALSVTANAASGPAQITLTGATGFYSLLQSSTNLTNWAPVATLVNSNGVVQFTDPGSTNQARRYYRAVVP